MAPNSNAIGATTGSGIGITNRDVPAPTVENTLHDIGNARRRLESTHHNLFWKLVQMGFVPHPAPEPAGGTTGEARHYEPNMLEQLVSESHFLNNIANHFEAATEAISRQYCPPQINSPVG